MNIFDLKHDKRNARKRNKRASETIEHSLRELGAARSIVIDKHGQIIAGNGVIENATKAGITEIEVVQSDGSKIIAVQRTDLDLDLDDKARKLAIADNRTAELAEWNPEVLAELSAELDMQPYFSGDELSEVLGLKVLPETSEDTSDAPDQTDALASSFSVLVTCTSEQGQAELLERLTNEGYECRSLIV